MALDIDFIVVDDPAGHREALLLRGDWIFAVISDGRLTGVGEATHSGDDPACIALMREIFLEHVAGAQITPEGVASLETGAFSEAPGRLEAGARLAATAVSALDQALWDLLARREGVPVWRLFAAEPARREIPLYATINRALGARDAADCLRVATLAREQGFRAIKCAPFDAVRPGAPPDEQATSAREGLGTLAMLRRELPELSLRVDCHKRFAPRAFARVLGELDSLGLEWIEEPCEVGPCYADFRRDSRTPFAAGELHFGTGEFDRICRSGWANVVMPDVKHVGGFGPLVGVCRLAEELGAGVSPHNPSGPVSTAASAHAGAVSRAVSSVEFPLDAEGRRAPFGEKISAGVIRVTDEPGWGLDVAALRAAGRPG